MKRFAAVIAILFTLLVPAAFGQATDSNLVGAVLDATGAAIQNASVEIQNVATGVKMTTKSGADGQYRFNNVPIGQYNVTATASGFATSSLKGVSLDLNKTATANVTMQVGTVATALEVSEAGVTIDTTTAQVGTTYEARQIVDLPIIENSNGLYGALQLSLLGAGVASNGGVGQGTGPSVGGQRPMNNNFMVEGVDNNNKTVTGPNVYVPTEATAEFTLLQNQFGAEFGHSTGGQFNTVIKSGTNGFHGSAYEYFQNRNLNAVDAQSVNSGIRENQRFDQNKLGGSLGGPIKKDKLFFFGNFEYSPLGQAFTPAFPSETPTAAGFALLDKMSNISKTNYSVFKQYVPPAPTQDLSCKGGCTTDVNGVAIPFGILPISGSAFTNFYTYLGSVDYNITDKDQLRGRIIMNKYDAIDNNAQLPTFWSTLPQRYWLATVSQYHTFSPNVTNELRLSYSRFSQFYTVGDFKFPGLDVFPNISLDDLGIQIGPNSNAPQWAVQNTYQLVDNINWTKGKHTLKFGFDIRDSISPQHFVQRERGDYEYGALEELLTDAVPSVFAERNLGQINYYGNQWATYFYANDNWRVTRNLSVNLGLRFERTGIPLSENDHALNSAASVPGLISFKAPSAYNKGWAPRVGIAYSPGTSGRTSIRAGFGMAYDVLFDNIGSTAYPPQESITYDAAPSTPQAPTPYRDGTFLANGGISSKLVPSAGNLSAAAARNATSSYIPDQIPPTSVQWNLGVQHVFKNDYTLEVRYLGSHGYHLITQNQLNKIAKCSESLACLPTYTTAPTQAQLDSLPLTLAQVNARSAIGPAWNAAGFGGTNITAFMPWSSSLYHGLATQLTRRFSHGLQAQGAYTWSHNMDNATATHFSTVLSPRRPQDFSNLKNEWSASPLDHRHRLTLSWLWETPWMKDSNNWAAKNLIGNWRVVGTYTAETGELTTPQSGLDANGNGDSVDRTIVNPAGQANLGSDATALKNTKGDTVAYLATNPNARYIKASAGTFPNAGRNTLKMPGINNWDMSLAKRFRITESKSFEIRGDAANLFNHAQYTAGYINSVRLTSNINSRTFLFPSASQFAQWSNNFPSNSRTMQLVAKFVF